MIRIAKLIDRLRARDSVSCDDLKVDRTALRELQDADVSNLVNTKEPPRQVPRKVVNA